jgi:predicted DNA repair protein MutK
MFETVLDALHHALTDLGDLLTSHGSGPGHEVLGSVKTSGDVATVKPSGDVATVKPSGDVAAVKGNAVGGLKPSTNGIDGVGHESGVDGEGPSVNPAEESTEAAEQIDKANKNKPTAKQIAAKKIADKEKKDREEKLRRALIRHQRFSDYLLKQAMPRSIKSTAIVASGAAAILGASDYFDEAWIFESPPAKLFLVVLAAHIALVANRELLGAMKHSSSLAPQLAHTVGDAPDDAKVLGEVIEDTTRSDSKHPFLADIALKAKMMSVLVCVIATQPVMRQALFLTVASTLMACGAYLAIAGLVKTEAFGEKQESHDLETGPINKVRNNMSMSDVWRATTLMVTERSDTITAATLNLAESLPQILQVVAFEAYAYGMAELGIRMLASSAATKFSDVNYDARLGWAIQKKARSAFHALPAIVLLGLYATGGRILGDGIEPIGNMYEYCAEFVEHLPVIGSAATGFAARGLVWAVAGSALGGMLLGRQGRTDAIKYFKERLAIKRAFDTARSTFGARKVLSISELESILASDADPERLYAVLRTPTRDPKCNL